LYQADWFYDFMVLKPMKFSNNPFLEVDPKWVGVAKHHISSNNSACTAGNDLRVPGIGKIST
jgi:predicted DNA-binding helix-hairpin-helix protein